MKMLLRSHRPGRYSDTYTQFDTIQKLQSTFSNHCRVSAKSNQTSMALGDQKGKYQHLSSDGCSLFWFFRFVEGACHQMGQDWRPKKAIPVDLLLLLLEATELRIQEAVYLRDENRWLVFHAYVVVCYTVLLQGCEGVLLDLSRLNWKFTAGGNKYVVLALLGQIKGEFGDQAHLIPCVPVTSSGINVGASVSRLMEFKRACRHTSGPAISDVLGSLLNHPLMNDALLEVLEELYDTHKELFPASLSHKPMLHKRIQVYRTLERTSDPWALEQIVAQSDIDVVDRWKALEQGDGNRPNRCMRQHYAELELLLGPFLCYTWAM
jgi:hypothetical protein